MKIALLKFLTCASDFYEGLALKLQATFGGAGFVVSARRQGPSEGVAPAGSHSAQPPRPQEPPARGVDVKISVYRCLICLGDLARCASGRPQAWTASLYQVMQLRVSPLTVAQPLQVRSQCGVGGGSVGLEQR